MEQQYILKNCKSFELKDIFECGQCFRWNQNEDESYTGVFGDNVINVSEKENGDVLFEGVCEGNIQTICEEYFDIKRDYEKIKETLSQEDENLAESIKYGKGIRILNQDLWETIISFIISANNNIPRIKGIIERISKKYGKEIKFRGNSYYTFPTIESLNKASIKDLRDLGLGFRDKYIYNTTKLIIKKQINIEELKEKETTIEMRNELLKLSGVGPKVADCILLFSDLKRMDVFPIDVWVRRVMNELYIHNPDEAKVSKKQIEKIAENKFGDLRGVAQQYLFYWKREN
ncbi:MAG: DNA-3-methyladenine glycosylase family protein [Clostridia bacterium]